MFSNHLYIFETYILINRNRVIIKLSLTIYFLNKLLLLVHVTLIAWWILVTNEKKARRQE